MKKFFLLLSACLTLAGTARAQSSLSNLLNSVKESTSSSSSSSSSGILGTITDVVSSVVNSATTVSLPGSWTYTGLAMSLEGDNMLTNVAGSAVSSTAANKIEPYLEKVGITEGSIKFTFEEDSSFSCTVKNIPLSGTWTSLNDGASVQLKFGKTLSYLSMTGDLTKTTSGCNILFDSDSFLSFLKTILGLLSSQSSTASTISSLADNYSGMQLGLALSQD